MGHPNESEDAEEGPGDLPRELVRPWSVTRGSLGPWGGPWVRV